MAKKKAKSRRSRKKPRAASPAAFAARWRKPKLRAVIVGAALLATAVYGGWSWWDWRQADARFQTLAAKGRFALGQVQILPSEGTGHVSPGEQMFYRSDPPTSGRHDATPVEPGLYDEPQRPAMLVHSLEHGNIVIYYDRPGREALQRFEAWAEFHSGTWSGVIVTLKSGLGKAIILTAWKRLLRLDPFNANAAAAFINAYRGCSHDVPTVRSMSERCHDRT